MRSLRTCAWLVLLAFGCSGSNKHPDAGTPVDTSCGLDCEQQKLYGLLKSNCFEYTDTGVAQNPAVLGVLVRDTFTLEGNVKTMAVDYSEGGQLKMTDYFAFPNRILTLMRREYAGTTEQSVTYKDSMNNIIGAPWTDDQNPSDGTTADNMRTAFLVTSQSMSSMEMTDYRVTTVTADPSELSPPAQSFDGGYTLVFNETPDHGVDGKRTLVPQVGFIAFSSPFQLSGGTATSYTLQKARTIDANATVCGFGGP
jgi:hypothetical protein